MRRPAIALLVVLGALALPAGAPAQATLTPSQFAGVDAVYVAFGTFEDGATTAERRAARAACAQLGSADPLLPALRRACFPSCVSGRRSARRSAKAAARACWPRAR